MAKCVTYSLENNRKALGSFYTYLSIFTDSILWDLNPETEDFVRDFCNFANESKIETFRSHNEYLVEFLMIGLYWNNYSGNASITGNLSKRVLRTLYAQRKRFPKYKPEIDKVRGYLAYIFLEKNKPTLSARFNLQGFISLLSWLDATGEFNEEVLRLRNWIAFCKTKDGSYIAGLIETSVLFAEQFSEKGKEILSKYVPNLNDFHQKSLPDYKYKEDYFFASRRENEYFLNMFAAEILNRGLKKGFTETREKVLLLPTCMRKEPATGCKAKSDGKELVCAACSVECNIGKVSAEMKKLGITSYLIPHSSDFSKFLVKWKDCSDTSLIGVACVLNLITGGYEMKRLNISSQCVFLDYCGCKKHWDNEGFATSLNIIQLNKVVKKPVVISEKQHLLLAD
jgi:hypothetical protein